MVEKYYLGLDMGTSSVGWAVTGIDYKLLRAKGKDLWGVRLFQEAQTSASRRGYRTSRRRLQREKAKIAYLRSVFEEEINKVDPGFYQRLDDSKYFPEDKIEKQKFTLFAGTDYNDKDYYTQYPTIFHLRKALIESDEPKDVRLVFLAILNIFKHRGHFLNENLSGEGTLSLKNLYDSLLEVTKNFPSSVDISAIEEILSSNKISNSVRAEQLRQLLGINKKMPEEEMVKLLCGLKGQLSKAFPEDTFDEDHKKYSISFRDGNYEEKEAEVSGILSEEAMEVFRLLKQIHDYGLLANITQGEPYLSFARVKTYEKHAYDLDVLQEAYKKYAKGSYNKMFRVMDTNNYSAYVGSVNSDKEIGKQRRGAKCKQEDFFKRLKKDLEEMKKTHPEDDTLAYMLEEIGKETFLPKQLTASNGVVPYQIHLAELKAILANAEKYLPFLKEVDETGLSVSERLIALFSFHIPYYIGPLYNDGKHNAWVSRKESGKVFPWNFEQKIDVKASSEAFIQRMVKQCTYLNQETVLPKSSLLYEKFMVLNELNNLKINDIRITPELKQKIYKEVFRVEKKVTVKKLRGYLQRIGVIGKGEEITITGIDGDFTNSLANYRKFQEIFGVEVLTYKQEEMAEQIIKWSTVYGDSKNFLKEKIEEVYGNELQPEQIKRILGIRFRDWGRLSKEFLLLEGADRDTGEIKTIISRMWDENFNLMELLSGNFTYLDEIQERGSAIEKTFTEIEYEDLEELYLSAPVKRMVWQTILV
ncbi:MAG: type II CRISPR RNA-guided endonuclease Cas9, partial [Muricoprocola sp.]